MYIGDVVQFNENHKWRGCLLVPRLSESDN